ncbi:hypothetical protein BDR07DRAFT_376155 [Suillus spraguei]|nr:hypothetical protein BDR07DRAFT_376155 [Suillus spraguei]
MAQKQKTTRCSFQSLPTEIVCNILKIVLESIVEDDIMETPGENWVLAGGLPSTVTITLVCKYWRNIVSSMPELRWIPWALPLEDQRMSSELKKLGSHPVNLAITQNPALIRPFSLGPFISPHLERLKSLMLNCLRLINIKPYGCATPLLKLECPALRILYVDNSTAIRLSHQWLKNNLRHIEVMAIYGGRPIDSPTSLAISQALQAIPRRIPCLILDNLQISLMQSHHITICAEKVILRTCIRGALVAFDVDCQTVVLQKCDSIHELRSLSLPPSNSLELDGCAAKFGIRCIPKTRPWDGDTVTITNSRSSCIKVILYLLGAPFAHRICCLWSCVTTLKLIAKGDFVMELPLITLKEMVSSRTEAVKRQDLDKGSREELDRMRPLMVLHVHGAQPLPYEEKMWFKKQVRDFVWD